MFGLLSLLPGVFSTINNITNAISNEKIAAINATTDQERVAAQERVASLQAQRDALIAESNRSKLPIYIQSLIAIGPTVFLTKVFIYDKVLSLGSTDRLDPNLWNVVMVVLGFYFISSMFTRR